MKPNKLEAEHMNDEMIPQWAEIAATAAHTYVHEVMKKTGGRGVENYWKSLASIIYKAYKNNYYLDERG